jgi:hypothetical protein
MVGAMSGSFFGASRPNTYEPGMRERRSESVDTGSERTRNSRVDGGPTLPDAGYVEEGDMPTLHDTLFNYIPASCFEIGTTLAILRQAWQCWQGH